MKTSLLILALLVPLRAWGAASEWAENAESRVRLVTPWQVAPQSGELRMGLHFKLAPEWHVYWKNSGDAGFPPVVVFQNLGEAELLWPAPERFELPGDLVAFGYADEVVYPVRAKVDAQSDRLRLVADVDYLVCKVDCVPYRYTLTLDQPLGSPIPDTETTPLIDRAWASVPTPPSQGVTTTAALDMSRPSAPVLEVLVEGARPGPESNLFLESHEAFDTGKPVSRTTDGGVIYRVPLKPREEGMVPVTTTVGWTVTHLVRNGEPLNLESRQQIGRKKAETRTSLRSPMLTAGLAAASALLALGLWGLLSREASHGHGRMLLGFVAAAATVGMLYLLSRQVRPEGLAAVELALLAMGLCAWLRRRSGRTLRIGLLVALLGCALAAPWLAERNRIPGENVQA